MKHAEAALIAPHARRWLDVADGVRVLHVFEQVCNLVDGRNEVVSLTSPPLGPDPLAILLSDPIDFTRYVDAADAPSITTTQIAFGSLFIDLTPAEDWNPHPDWLSAHAHLDRVQAHLPLVIALMRQHAPSDSFATLVIGDTAGASICPAGQTRAIVAAREPASLLVEGLLAGDELACLDSAQRLAGLGSGLTPSGDDFIVGVLYALCLLHPTDAVPLGTAIARRAAPRTTRLSAAWLNAAAHGEAGSLWHALIDALTVGDDASLQIAVMDLLRVGHTSGADALAGFVAILTGGNRA
jgi:hypothetical protein